jgi:signal transduction histidine kinase
VNILKKHKLISITLATVFLILGTTLFGVNFLWNRILLYHANQLANQIRMNLVHQIEEGNFLEITAALGRLKMAGLFNEVALVQSNQESVDWLYVSSQNFKNKILNYKPVRNLCVTPSFEYQDLHNNSITFTINLKALPESVVNTCAIAQANLSDQLIFLHRIVLAVFALVTLSAIALLTFLIVNFEKKKQEAQKAAMEREAHFANELVNLSKQVSHDIRSPLTALNLVISDIKNVPEENRLLIRSAASRINDIANQLLQQSKGNLKTDTESSNNKKAVNSSGNIEDGKSALSPELLPAVLDLIVSEKRVQFRGNSRVAVETDFEDSYGAFALINPAEFKRVISNLINNSIEAFNGNSGRIIVSVRNYSSKKIVSVRDNGQGIPPHILEKLGELGVSHGKEGTDSGSGLGIYHAKKTIESFGATFTINSRQNFGTEIRMEFPICEQPEWFVPEIKVSPGQRVLALDDDESILEIWRQRIDSLNISSMELLTFTSAQEFSSWIDSENHRYDKDIYLMDFELFGQSTSGLSLIEKYSLEKKAILVTSRYEELNIRTQCEKLKVKILPKALATIVPIEIGFSTEHNNKTLPELCRLSTPNHNSSH